jgi:hypothetical protein
MKSTASNTGETSNHLPLLSYDNDHIYTLEPLENTMPGARFYSINTEAKQAKNFNDLDQRISFPLERTLGRQDCIFCVVENTQHITKESAASTTHRGNELKKRSQNILTDINKALHVYLGRQTSTIPATQQIHDHSILNRNNKDQTVSGTIHLSITFILPFSPKMTFNNFLKNVSDILEDLSLDQLFTLINLVKYLFNTIPNLTTHKPASHHWQLAVFENLVSELRELQTLLANNNNEYTDSLSQQLFSIIGQATLLSKPIFDELFPAALTSKEMASIFLKDLDEQLLKEPDENEAPSTDQPPQPQLSYNEKLACRVTRLQKLGAENIITLLIAIDEMRPELSAKTPENQLATALLDITDKIAAIEPCNFETFKAYLESAASLLSVIDCNSGQPDKLYQLQRTIKTDVLRIINALSMAMATPALEIAQEKLYRAHRQIKEATITAHQTLEFCQSLVNEVAINASNNTLSVEGVKNFVDSAIHAANMKMDATPEIYSLQELLRPGFCKDDPAQIHPKVISPDSITNVVLTLQVPIASFHQTAKTPGDSSDITQRPVLSTANSL